MSTEDIMALLRAIKEQLNGIEARQIHTTAIVQDVKEHEAPVVGSFATLDSGKTPEGH